MAEHTLIPACLDRRGLGANVGRTTPAARRTYQSDHCVMANGKRAAAFVG